MSRYIDADSLIESVCHTADLGGWIGDTLRNIKRLAVRYINDVPSIDICFCRECKYRKHRVDFQNDYCIQHSKVLYSTDGYCSWGEREGE